MQRDDLFDPPHIYYGGHPSASGETAVWDGSNSMTHHQQHPLVASVSTTPRNANFASVARNEWRSGTAVTQSLEELRTHNIRVVTAQSRVDVAGSQYTAYLIQLPDQSIVEHRYSDFYKLQALIQPYAIVPFPSKTSVTDLWNQRWAPQKYEEWVAQRVIQLDMWLVQIMQLQQQQQLPEHVQDAIHAFLYEPTPLPCHQNNNISSSSQWNNPIAFTLGSCVRQATKTIQLLTTSKDHSIPADLLQAAQGICVLTVAKAGLVVSGRIGTGLVVAKLSDNNNNNNWSAPCAIGTVGLGWGAQLGGNVTEYLVILTSSKAVQDLVASQVTLGAELGIAVGPVGRCADSHLQTGDWTIHPAYAYAHSQGLFVGMSLEGSVVATRHDVNSKFYGRQVTPSELLMQSGPKAAEPLYEALHMALQTPIPQGAFRPSQLFSPNKVNPESPLRSTYHLTNGHAAIHPVDGSAYGDDCGGSGTWHQSGSIRPAPSITHAAPWAFAGT